MSKFRIEIEIPDEKLPKDNTAKVFMVDGMLAEALADFDEIAGSATIFDVMLIDNFTHEDI